MNENTKNLILLGLLSSAVSTNIYLSVPNLDLISKEFVINDLVVSIIASSFFFFFGLAAVFWGFVIDKYNLNRKRGLIYAILLAICFDMLASVASNAYVLLIANIMIGISLGFSVPAIYGVIVDYFPLEKRLFAIAVWNLLSAIGSTLGYAFAFASGILGSWRYAFIIAAIALIISLSFLGIIREPIKGQSEKELKELFEKGVLYDYTLNEQEFILTLSRKTNALLALQSLFISAGWGAYMGWGIHFITREAYLDKIQAAAILGLVGLGGASSIILARIVQRFQTANLKIKLFLAGIFVSAEGTAYIIMYSLLKMLNIDIASSEIITSIMKLLETLSQNKIFLTAIIIGAIGNFLGSTAGPIRGSVISEVNAPEEKSALMGTMVVADHIGRSIGIFLVGVISFITKSLYIGLIVSFALYYIGGLSWFFASKSFLADRNRLLDILEKRKSELLNRNKN